MLEKSLAFFRTVKSILEIPSAVLVGSWISVDIHRMEFIFRRSDVVMVSDIMLKWACFFNLDAYNRGTHVYIITDHVNS